MKLTDVAEDKRRQAEKLRKKLCETAVGRVGFHEDVCQNCASPCEYGCQLMDLLGLPKQKRIARMQDVFESVHHSRGRRAQHVVNAMNRWRRR